MPTSPRARGEFCACAPARSYRHAEEEPPHRRLVAARRAPRLFKLALKRICDERLRGSAICSKGRVQANARRH